MKQVILKRLCEDEKTIVGHLSIDGEFVSFTIENRKKSYPAGKYQFKLTKTKTTMPAKYRGHAYEVCEIPGRSSIKFHVANKYSQLEGCTAPNQIVYSDAKKGFYGGQSGPAVERFMDMMDGVEEAELIVEW